MKTLLLCVATVLALSVAGLGHAAGAFGGFSEKQLAQQQRMTDCSAEAKAKGMNGDERRAFMKTCLSGGSVTVVVGDGTDPTPDDGGNESRRQASCAAEADHQGLEGEARKQFIRDCPTP